MATKKLYGLTSVLIGAIANDGGMGTVLTELLGATAKDSASLVYTEPTIEDVEIEEIDDPYDQIITTAGKWELKLNSYNVSAKTMGDVVGGTFTAGTGGAADTWESPDQLVQQERSVRVTTRSGMVIDLPRVKYMAIPQFDFAKSKLGTLNLTGTALKPTKTGVKTVKLSDPV